MKHERYGPCTQKSQSSKTDSLFENLFLQYTHIQMNIFILGANGNIQLL